MLTWLASQWIAAALVDSQLLTLFNLACLNSIEENKKKPKAHFQFGVLRG